MMYKFILKGVLQGVGFRPFIYNQCKKNKLKGYVQNIGEGVIVEVDKKDEFINILKNLPPLARLDSYKIVATDNKFDDFSIKESFGGGFSEIPPDLFLCSDCLSELNNKENRRFKHFFITCTNCGPRFSATLKNPYDRNTTTMSEFIMCENCLKEYKSPEDRRYHAQTIACKNCGPRLSFFSNEKKVIEEKTDIDKIKLACGILLNNEVIAIKGIGGFHLAALTTQDGIINLRETVKRKHKPFAVMCKDLNMIKSICYVNNKEEELLTSKERPIVILKKINNSEFKDVSELNSLGIMLPYTGLHYLLFDFINQPIILTSSNISDEPITSTLDEQYTNVILNHNRKIENPIDDSLVKVISDKTFLIRRSRGFVPRSITMESNIKKQILALGAEMSNTFCIYKENKATLSQYLGTTSNPLTLEYFKKTVRKFLQFTNTNPDLILCDLHPGYYTTQFAKELSKELKIPLIQIQHHKAHAFSAAYENGFNDFISIVCDGLGFGEDSTIWGGEIFHNNERVGHLEYQNQLGGDSAAAYPAKMLFSILRNFLKKEDSLKYLRDYYSISEIEILDKQLANKFNCPKTSSCGRILDAASFLLGFCDERTYEGRPAMLLESNSSIPLDINPVIENNILLTTPLFKFIIEHFDKDKSILAATVQKYLAVGLYEIAKQYNKPIVFSGGCAYNNIMSEFLISRGVKTNINIPCGDGGISFGQIAYFLANSRDNIS